MKASPLQTLSLTGSPSIPTSSRASALGLTAKEGAMFSLPSPTCSGKAQQPVAPVAQG